MNKIILIIVVAVIFSVLMGIRGEMPFLWQRAIIAAVAGGVVGWLISYLFRLAKLESSATIPDTASVDLHF